MQKYLLKNEAIYIDFENVEYDVLNLDDGDCDEENEFMDDDDADDFCE